MKPTLVTIDLETYYDQQFSLSKITTEAYVRDARFEVIGAAIKIGDGETVWYPQPEVRAALEAIDWSDKLVLAQNTMFDGAILRWRYGVNPMAWLDTMCMSRALYPHEKSHSLKMQARRMGLWEKGDEVLHALGKRYSDFSPEELARYGEYCINDVELTAALAQEYFEMGFPLKELKLIDLTLRMFIDPVLLLERPLLEQHLKTVRERKQALMERVRDKLTGVESDEDLKKLMMSNDKFAQLLDAQGVEPPTKISATTGLKTWAFAKTDEGFMELLESADETVQALAACRLGNKSTLEETRTERFIATSIRGTLPIPLKYFGAHSGRWSGQDSVNLQNLPSRGKGANTLKRAILPPPGHVMIDCDSAQIEARTLAWLAGQDDLVTAFRNKEDVYKLMASRIYRKPVEEIDKGERQIGKTVVLGAGYSAGWKKLQAFLKTQAGVEVEDAEAQRIINTYRGGFPMIPLLWEQADRALGALAMGQTMQVDVPGIINVVPGMGLTLPNKLFIRYPGLRRQRDADGRAEWVYESKGALTKIYGGKVVENCIAEGTLVLTDRGWIPIETVECTDKVHDGVGFVSHGGKVTKGLQECVRIDGVAMTPDHEVFTNEGWKTALEKPEPYRPNLWNISGAAYKSFRWEKDALGFSLPVWEAMHKNWSGCNQRGEARRNAELWLSNQNTNKQTQFAPWNEQASRLFSLEKYVSPMSVALASRMERLWGTWDNCVRGMAGFVRELLERYGSNIRIGAYLGQNRQYCGVLPSELPLGYLQTTSVKPQGVSWDRLETDIHSHRHTQINTVLQTTERTSTHKVWDIKNCGPRHRFVVKGVKGPFIVHNCSQAVARCIVGEQMLKIAKRYKVVLTVHDSVAIIAPEHEAEDAVRYVESCMSWTPAWAKGLPLACESGVGPSYGDC